MHIQEFYYLDLLTVIVITADPEHVGLQLFL